MLKRGSITLELLITIVVSTPLLLSIITVLKESIGVHLRVMIESQDNESLLRLRSIIHETIVELDQHRLELPARIHHAGQIRFSNNTDNPVMRSRTNPPATNSDAITSAKLAVQNSLIVNQAITLGSRIIFTCCERFAEPFNKDDYKSYLGVHADGVIELTGSLTQLSSAPSCWELNATPEISMIADSSNPDLTGNIRLIIPIDRLYTIYLNDKEELRFLGHSGESNNENQPILTDLKYINLLANSVLGGTHVAIDTSFTTTSSKQFRFTEVNHLGRIPFFNLLLNRP